MYTGRDDADELVRRDSGKATEADTSAVCAINRHLRPIRTCLLDVPPFSVYNTCMITRTIDRHAIVSLPLAGGLEAEGGRPTWTAIWQLPACQPVGTGWLCRGLPRTTCAAQSASGHQ